MTYHRWRSRFLKISWESAKFESGGGREVEKQAAAGEDWVSKGPGHPATEMVLS